ncbi:hypothetical protein HDE_03254 [Halotydeus destructor]|nr:hypothetical protein HDE_03254 [Halotydeus destructor]
MDGEVEMNGIYSHQSSQLVEEAEPREVWLVKIPKLMATEWARAGAICVNGQLQIRKSNGRPEILFDKTEDILSNCAKEEKSGIDSSLKTKMHAKQASQECDATTVNELHDETTNTSLPVTDSKLLERELREQKMLLQVKSSDLNTMREVLIAKEKKIAQLTFELSEMKKKDSIKSSLAFSSLFVQSASQTKKVAGIQSASTNNYLKHLSVEEKPNKRLPCAPIAEVFESDGSEEDEITADTFKSQKKARLLKSSRSEVKEQVTATSGRKKIPRNRSLLSSVSPVSQEEDTSTVVITNTGRKLRSKKPKGESTRKAKRALF